eukprot:gene1059-629_t
MPPRGRSKTQQALPEEGSKIPPSDPAAVQNLINDALHRAHSSRGTTPRRTRRTNEPECLVCRAWHSVFGNKAIEYDSQLTSKLTDAVGMFLVVIFTFYFTAAGYLCCND